MNVPFDELQADEFLRDLDARGERWPPPPALADRWGWDIEDVVAFCDGPAPLTRREAAELRALVRQVEAMLEPIAPVAGYRAASRVLGVSREKLAARIADLPARRRPAMVDGRPWFASPRDCAAWWADVHRVAPPTPRKRDRRGDVDPLAGGLDEAFRRLRKGRR